MRVKKYCIPGRMGCTMKHAGVAVTITSGTLVVHKVIRFIPNCEPTDRQSQYRNSFNAKKDIDYDSDIEFIVETLNTAKDLLLQYI